MDLEFYRNRCFGMNLVDDAQVLKKKTGSYNVKAKTAAGTLRCD